LEQSRATAQSGLKKKIGEKKLLVSDEQVRMFGQGFVVSAAGGDDEAAYVSFSGVLNRIPYNFVLTYHLGVLRASNVEKDYRDVMWVELSISSPAEKMFRIPLKANGVVRDPTSGAAVRILDFEVVPDLVSDAGDLLKILGCILACVGAACGWECIGPCLSSFQQ
jgi:hypothetical protein